MNTRELKRQAILNMYYNYDKTVEAYDQLKDNSSVSPEFKKLLVDYIADKRNKRDMGQILQYTKIKNYLYIRR